MANIPYPNNFDDDFMNIFKEVITMMNKMGYTYEESLQKAREILEEAQQTNDLNVDVQQQIDNLILENGESDAEVIQARGDAPLLKDRLDKTDSQLAQKVTSKNTKVLSINPAIESNNGYYPLWISENGTIYASRYGSQLHKSTNGGETYNLIYNFPRRIQAVRELDNGELLVGIDYETDVTPGEDFISSNNQTVFTKVITHSDNSRLYGAWNVNVHENIILLGEYGNQGKAQKVWLSEDYGETFTQIFDLANYASVPSAAHLHGVLYDKYWNRIWLIHGDGIIDGNDNQGGYYSDDMGQTWTRMHVGNQLLNMHALEDSVLFFTDSAPNGIYRYQRTTKEEQPKLELIYRTDNENVSITWLCTSLFRKNEQEPLIMGFKSTAGGSLPPFVLATYNGIDYFELWRDDVAQSSGTDISFLQLGDKLIGSTTGDTRNTYGTKITADIIKKPNEVSTSLKGIRHPFIDIRDLGLLGNGVDETREMLNAFRYASDVKGTLYIPKEMTVTVQDMTINGLSDFNLLCLGNIKLTSLPSGGNGKNLKLDSCSNITIYELNTVGNSNTLSTLQNSLDIANCANIHVVKLNVKNPNGNVLRIEGSENINVDKVIARGNNTGGNTLLLMASENISIKEIDSDGVGAIGNTGIYGIRIVTTSTSQTIKNIHIGKLKFRSGGHGGLSISKASGSTIENIRIDELDITKTSDFVYTVRTNAANIVNVQGVNGFKLKGKVFEDKTSDLRGTGLFMNDVNDFDIDLSVNNVHVAYIIGEKGIFNGKLKGETKSIGFDAMRLAYAENTDFSIKFGDYSNETASRYNIITYGTNKVLTNVKFKDCYFTKPTDSLNNVLIDGSVNTDVIVFDCDFSEWKNSPETQKFIVNTGGLSRRNNLGLNWTNSIPSSTYWNKGDFIYNTDPSVGGYLGWVCVESGSPGTWKGFGLIEA